MSACESCGTARPFLNESITGFNFARTNGLKKSFFLCLVWWLLRFHRCPMSSKTKDPVRFFSEKAWVSWKFQCSHQFSIQSDTTHPSDVLFDEQNHHLKETKTGKENGNVHKLPCLYATWCFFGEICVPTKTVNVVSLWRTNPGPTLGSTGAVKG